MLRVVLICEICKMVVEVVECVTVVLLLVNGPATNAVAAEPTRQSDMPRARTRFWSDTTMSERCRPEIDCVLELIVF